MFCEMADKMLLLSVNNRWSYQSTIYPSTIKMLSMKTTRYESKIQATKSTTVYVSLYVTIVHALCVTTVTDEMYCKHFNETQKQVIVR